MKKPRFVLFTIAAALCLIAFTSAVRAGAAKSGNPAPHEVANFHEVEFMEPMAWDCKEHETCLTCTNISGAPSDVVVVHAPGDEETHPIKAGLDVRICGTVVFIPHNG